MKPYQPWEFCKAIDCDALSVIHQDQRMKKVYCYRCYAYRMHQYLKDHGQILEEGSELAKRLEGDNNGVKGNGNQAERNRA